MGGATLKHPLVILSALQRVIEKRKEQQGWKGENKEREGIEGENSSIFQVLNAKPLQQLSLHASLYLIRAKIQ